MSSKQHTGSKEDDTAFIHKDKPDINEFSRMQLAAIHLLRGNRSGKSKVKLGDLYNTAFTKSNK